MVPDTVAIMESNMVADMEVDNVAIYIYNKYQKYKSVELADQLSWPTSLREVIKKHYFYGQADRKGCPPTPPLPSPLTVRVL